MLANIMSLAALSELTTELGLDNTEFSSTCQHQFYRRQRMLEVMNHTILHS